MPVPIQKRSVIPEVSYRALWAHLPTFQQADESPRAQVFCDFSPDCSFSSFRQAHHSNQQKDQVCSEQTHCNFTQNQNKHTPDPSPQIQETQMELKPRAPKQAKMRSHTNPPWKQQLPASFSSLLKTNKQKGRTNNAPKDCKPFSNLYKTYFSDFFSTLTQSPTFQ